MANGYRVFELEATFVSGMAVQRVISYICRKGAGDISSPKFENGRVAFEVYTHNPLVMAWIEDQLAPFV
jgi:hypothetical protein